MNSAKLNNSPRLQRVLQVLSTGREYSTLDIIRRARVCAVNSIVSELRDNGVDIHCERRDNIWYYRMGK